jgi:hypothetical protein
MKKKTMIIMGAIIVPFILISIFSFVIIGNKVTLGSQNKIHFDVLFNNKTYFVDDMIEIQVLNTSESNIIEWNIGNGSIYEGRKPGFSINHSGHYNIFINVSNGRRVKTEIISISIYNLPVEKSRDVARVIDIVPFQSSGPGIGIGLLPGISCPEIEYEFSISNAIGTFIFEIRLWKEGELITDDRIERTYYGQDDIIGDIIDTNNLDYDMNVHHGFEIILFVKNGMGGSVGMYCGATFMEGDNDAYQ